MATSLRELIVSVTADTSRYQREMDRASRMGAQYFRTVREGGADANRSWSTQTAAARTHATAIEAGTQAITRYAGAMAAAIGAGQLVQLADGWTNLNNRLKLVTDGAESFARAQGDVLRIAQATRQPLDATAELYQRIAMNQEALELSGQDLARVVETISKTMVISGTSAAGAQAALVQLGQAFASGTLRGEELNSVLEQAPALAQAIAAGLGVPIGKLREMGKAGELTAEQVIGALQSQSAAVDEAFGKMDATIGQAMTNILTSFQVFVGKSSDVSGASTAIAESMNLIAQNMETLAVVGGGAAIGALAGKMVQMASATAKAAVSSVQSRIAAIAEAAAMRDATLAAQLKAQADLRRAQAAMGATRGTAESARQSRNLAAALLAERQATVAATAAQTAYARATSASAAAGRAALGLLGGPAGLAITVGMVAAGWLLFRDNTDEAASALDNWSGSADEAVAKFRELNKAQQAGAILQLSDEIDAAIRKISKSIAIIGNEADFTDLYGTFADQLQRLQNEFNSGTLPADQFANSVSRMADELAATGQIEEVQRRGLIQYAAEVGNSAREVERKRGILDAFNGVNKETERQAGGTAGAIRGQAGAFVGLGEEATKASQRMQSALQSLPGQIARIGKSAREVAVLDVADTFAAMQKDGVNFADRSNPQVQEAMRQGAEYIRLQVQLADAQDRYAGATKAASAATGEAKRKEEEARREAERQIETYNDLIAAQERQIALFGNTSKAAEVAYDSMHGALSKYSDAQKSQLQQNAEWLDWLEEMAVIQGVWDDAAKAQQKYAAKAGKEFDALAATADQAARNIQSYLGDSMYNILDGKFSDIGDSFSQMIKRMLSELAASQLLNMLGGAMAGYAGEGGFGNFIRGVGGSITKGAGKAGGGVAQPRTMMPVAEHGPELLQVGGQTMLMMGAQQGLVSPLMNKAGGGASMAGGAMQVIINNNGDSKVSARQERGTADDGSSMRKLIIDIIADDIASGGATAMAGKGRYGWQEAL